jgi:hypothetical protein
MKYTIELTNKQKAQMDCMIDIVHRYVGFNPKLEPIEGLWENELEKAKLFAYKNGFEHGKKQAINELPELANKENEIYNDGYNKGIEDFENLFVCEHDYEQFFEDTYGSKNPDYNLYDLVAKYGAKKVINDFKKWQEEKKKAEEEIKVGDEVVCNCPNEQRVIITAKYDNWVTFMRKDGACYSRAETGIIKKTGRHFDEIEQLLDKLRGEDND